MLPGKEKDPCCFDLVVIASYTCTFTCFTPFPELPNVYYFSSNEQAIQNRFASVFTAS